MHFQRIENSTPVNRLLPLNDSNSARIFILVASHVASSHLYCPAIGEYLHLSRFVGTQPGEFQLELTYGEYFARHGKYCGLTAETFLDDCPVSSN